MIEGYSPAFTVFGAILVAYYVISSALNFLTARLEKYMQDRLRGAHASETVVSVRRQAEESV